MATLWRVSEDLLWVYFQGRYLLAAFFLARAVSWSAVNSEQTSAAAKSVQARGGILSDPCGVDAWTPT